MIKIEKMHVINATSENKHKFVLICRLCGEASNSYLNIFGHEATTHSLSKKILLHLKVQVSSTDLLPKIVCNQCFNKLEEFHQFFLASKKVQLMLKSAITDSHKYSIKINIGTFKNELSNDIYSRIDQTSDKNISITHDSKRNRFHTSKVDSIYSVNKDLKEDGNIKLFEHYCNSSEEEIFVDNYNFHYKGILDLIDGKTNDTNENVFELANESEQNFDKQQSLIDSNMNHSQSVLEEDIDLMNMSIRLPCLSCKEIFTKPKELIHHFKQKHYNETPVFKCRICGNLIKDLKKFSRHYRKHENIQYTCKICGKSFGRQWTLQLHAAVHTDTKHYNCDQCDKSFKTVKTLRHHKKIHLPDEYKPMYTCDTCSKSFKSKFILTSHERNHTGQKNFICDICGEFFISKSSLLYHTTIHNYKEMFKCYLCHKLFCSEKTLERHMITHSFNKPFKCEYCGKQYCNFALLKQHRRLHTGELPYKCEICPKRFRVKNALITHERQHTGIKPFECKTCDHAFTDFSNFNKHMKRKHNNTNVIEKNNELILLKI